MSNKLIRQIRLINLIQSYPGITGSRLAEECEVDIRTIRRDIKELGEARIPITTLDNGRGYQFTSNFALYPLDWTEDEAMAFSVLSSIEDSVQALFPPDFRPAYQKVMAAYRAERNRKTDVIEQVAQSIQLGRPAHNKTNTNFLSSIMQATIGSTTIVAEYYTQSSGELSKRRIDPYYLIPRENQFYLIGYCHKREDILVFRVSRFHGVELTKDSFEKEGFNLRNYMKDTWSIIRGKKLIRFKVRFSAVAAKYVREEELFVEPTLRNLPGGGLEMKVTLNHHQEFLHWLAKYGPEAEIIEPVEYREYMREQLAQWSKLYEV